MMRTQNPQGTANVTAQSLFPQRYKATGAYATLKGLDPSISHYIMRVKV